MKKIISLLLVLVLSVGLMSGIALADAPMETTEAAAGVKVTFSGSDEPHFFETLTPELLTWACKEMPGAPTFTLLKDLELSNPGETGASFLVIPQANADWYQAKQPAQNDKLPVTFDLNDKTLKYEGASNLLRIYRWGAEIKNGTIVYTGTAEGSRGIFNFGNTTGAVGNSSGVVWTPELVLDNVTCLSLNSKASPVLCSYVYQPKITVKDSVLWSDSAAAMILEKSDQSTIGSSKPVEVYAPEIEITDSVVGSGKHYFLTSNNPGVTVSVKDSALVTNHKTGLLMKKDNPTTLDTKGQDSVEKEGWLHEAAGTAFSGKATVVGSDPAGIELPFTDVQESDWFYSFVSEMYAKKVINGMTETTFVPNGNLTYGQALKLIVAGLGVDAYEADGHWASGYLRLAKENGWITGDVDPDGAVTRLAFCRIAASAKNLTEQPASNPFKDTADPSVLALVNAGVINGMSADTFAPDTVLTRAQIAKIISLLIKL